MSFQFLLTCTAMTMITNGLIPLLLWLVQSLFKTLSLLTLPLLLPQLLPPLLPFTVSSPKHHFLLLLPLHHLHCHHCLPPSLLLHQSWSYTEFSAFAVNYFSYGNLLSMFDFSLAKKESPYRKINCFLASQKHSPKVLIVWCIQIFVALVACKMFILVMMELLSLLT